MSGQFVVESIKIQNPFENQVWEEDTTDSMDIPDTETDFDFLSDKIKSINAIKSFQENDNEEFTASKGLTSRYNATKPKNKTFTEGTLQSQQQQQPKNSNSNLNCNHHNTFSSQAYYPKSSPIINLPPVEQDHWNLMFAPSFNEELQRSHFIQTYKSLIYSTKQLRGPTEAYLKKMQITLPKLTKPSTKTLYIDLDETLITCMPLCKSPQHRLNSQLGISIRPYAHHLLHRLSLFYEIYIFTASTPTYASLIRTLLDPDSRYIQGLLTRTHCLQTKHGAWIKDLRIVKNREMKNCLIVDNLAHSFAFQIDQGVPVAGWNGDRADQELWYLTEYLEEIAKEDDLGKANRVKLRLEESMYELIRKHDQEQDTDNNNTYNND